MTFKVSVYTLLIITVIVLSKNHVYSQKFLVGVKAGATLSKSHFSDKEDNNEFTHLWKPGFLVSLTGNLRLMKNFSIQSEAGFSQRGRKIEFNNGTWFNNASYQFLDGSILLRKSFPLSRNRNTIGSWFINIGPKVSYWLSGQGKITADGNTTAYQIKFELPPTNQIAPDYYTMCLTDVNRWLLGWDLGIGVEAPSLSMENFIFELRYTSGQTCYGDKNSAQYPVPEFSDNLLSNEKMISFSIHYILNRDNKEGKKGKSTKGVKSSKHRKNFDSLLH